MLKRGLLMFLMVVGVALPVLSEDDFLDERVVVTERIMLSLMLADAENGLNIEYPRDRYGLVRISLNNDYIQAVMVVNDHLDVDKIQEKKQAVDARINGLSRGFNNTPFKITVRNTDDDEDSKSGKSTQ